MDIKENLVAEIQKEWGKDVSSLIEINSKNEFVCYNTSEFSFGMIFIGDFWKSGIHDCRNDPICKGCYCKQYIPMGTDEDNHFMTPKKYADILAGYYCVFYENKNRFILKIH